MENKKNKIIEIVLFSLILIGLMTVASFFDLQISQILTKGALKDGAYYTNNFMGALVEVIGSFPIFISLLVATLCFSNVFFKKENKLKHIGWIFVVLSIVDMTWLTRDTFKYILRLVGNEPLYKEWWMMIVYIVIAIIISLPCHYFFVKRIDENLNKKFLQFSWVIIFTCAFYLSINIIKGPVGRMRFRAMNELGDFSGYTPWYVISSAKDVFGKDTISDAFKSFPSGHTFSAGCCYVLLSVPDIFEKYNSKKYRVLSYVITICYTGLVGLYRIRVGAHYLSDVTIGGTIAYVASQVARYIFVTRKNKKRLVENEVNLKGSK